MACEKKLSEHLLSLGFFSALGTIEYAGGQPSFVTKGEPNIFDANNGMIVVYDEKGRPWIKGVGETAPSDEEYQHLFSAHVPRGRGARVPHSNDGGYFKRNVMHPLMAGEQDVKVPDFRVR